MIGTGMAVISNGKTLTSGLIIEDRNLIEFRMKGRRRRRIFATELLPSPLLLFPIYNVSTKSVNFENQSLIVETEVGLISKYILKEEKLNLDQITFEITEFSIRNEVYSLVSSIRYNRKKLVSITSDTVLTGRYEVS